MTEFLRFFVNPTVWGYPGGFALTTTFKKKRSFLFKAGVSRLIKGERYLAAPLCFEPTGCSPAEPVPDKRYLL
jgi:hypothetical protein